MKKISLILVAVMLLSLFTVPIVFADDEKDVFLDYNLENTWSGRYPDDKWGALNGNFEAATDDYGKAFKIKHYGEPYLKFGQTLKKGKLHVSFDIKIMSDYRNCLLVLYDGRLGGDPDTVSYDDSQISKALRINSYTNSFEWYQDGSSNLSMTKWVSTGVKITDDRFDGFFPEGTPDEEKTLKERWYHCDIVTTEMSETDARADYYVNGIKVNDNPVYFAGSKGFKAVGFRTEGFKGSADDSEADKLAYQNDGYVLVDNIRVSRYFGEEGIEGSVSGRVPLTAGASVNVSLSESVDSSLLIKENMTVINAASGDEFTDFEVSSQTDTGFTLTFANGLPSGNYELMLADNIIGGSLSYKMVNPVELRTEYKTQRVNTSYADMNFNGYSYTPPAEASVMTAEDDTVFEEAEEFEFAEFPEEVQEYIPASVSEDEDNSTLPAGWRNIGKLENTYAQSVAGKTAAQGDTALGFVNPERVTDHSRFIYTFENPIPALSEYEISFDIKLNNMNWFLYLLEPGDDNAETTGYNENAAIGSTASSGIVFYAGSRRLVPNSRFDNALKVESGAWHSVKLKVKPVLDSGAEYTVSVDNGTEYTASTNRAFDTSSTIGIGLGYVARQNQNGYMYVDNLKVTSDMNVMYPEVDRITYYSYDGTPVNAGNEMTTLIDKINVDFNTAVSADSASRAISISGGSDISYDVEVENVEGKSRAVVTLNRLLEKDKNYRITVSPGIASAYTNQITSEVAVNKSFGTRSDLSFRMFESGIDTANNKYVAKFVKNNSSAGKYTLAVAGYNNVTKNINGTSVTVRELVGINYLPIDITAGTKGILEYELSTNFGQICDVYEPYLWTYPQQLKVELGESNAVLN